MHIGNYGLTIPSLTPFFDVDTGAGTGSASAGEGATPSATPAAPVATPPAEPVFTPGVKLGEGHPLLASETPVPPTDGQVKQGTEPGQPAQPTEPTTPVSVVDKLKAQGVTKFDSEDAYVKSYVEIEKMNTRINQEKAQLATELDNQKKIVETLLQKINQPTQPEPQPTKPTQPTPEEIAAENDKLVELQLNNPTEYKNLILEEAKKQILEQLNPVIKPMIEERELAKSQNEWNRKAIDFANAVDDLTQQPLHPDFAEMQDYMSKAAQENPGIVSLPNAIELLYGIAKGMKASETASTPPIDPKALLKDQKFLEENVLNDPDIQKIILEKNLKAIKDGSPPPVINGQGATGGQPAVVPQVEPKNIKESGNLFRKFLQSAGIG